MGILISNPKFIITVDPRRRILRDSSIYIEDGKIVRIAKNEEVKRDYPSADIVIDAANNVITPGLINTHCHTNSRLARGLADNLFINSWVHERIRPFSGALKPEEANLSALAFGLDCLKSGTTCMAEYGGFHMDEAMKALYDIGMRAVVAMPMEGFWARGGSALETSIGALQDFIKKTRDQPDDRIQLSVSIPITASLQGWRRTKEIADENNILIQSHMSSCVESENEFKQTHRRSHEMPFLEEAKALGPNLLAVHSNWFSEEDIGLILQHKVKVNHCPTAAATGAYGQLKSGSILKMMEHSIPIALGSDGAASSNFLDMIRVAYQLVSHRDARIDASLFHAETLLEMITCNGAGALLLDRVTGSLEEGKAADIVLFDIKRHEWQPLHNPVSNLMFSASGATVDTVLVDGKVVVQAGVLKSMNQEEILGRMEKTAFDLAERSGIRDKVPKAWPIE